MASISLTEKDFDVLAETALNAQDRGDIDTAMALDKICRKLSAALSNEKYRTMRRYGSGQHSTLTWKDTPSLLIAKR